MTNKAKLLLFSHVCNTKSITGAEKMLIHMTLKLSKFFECAMVAPGEGEMTRIARENGIRVIVLNLPLLYGMHAPGPYFSEELERMRQSPQLAETVALIRDENADAVLTNTCVHVLPALAAEVLGVPLIWSITEVLIRTAFLQHSVDLIGQLSTRILTISDTVKSRFAGRVPEEKLGLLHPSWEWLQFRKDQWPVFRETRRSGWGLKPEHRLVGYISSFLTVEKGFEHFIDTALELCEARREVRFLIIGQRNDKDFYSQCLDKVNDSKYFSRFIFVPYERSVEEAYCAMDILVVPSLIPEGFGLSALEGMIHGKLTAAYRAGGLEVILGACGFGDYLAEMGNQTELSSKVNALLDLAPEQAEVLSTTAMVRSNAVFGPAAYEEQLRKEVARFVDARQDRLSFSIRDEGLVTRPRPPVEQPQVPIEAEQEEPEGSEGTPPVPVPVPDAQKIRRKSVIRRPKRSKNSKSSKSSFRRAKQKLKRKRQRKGRKGGRLLLVMKSKRRRLKKLSLRRSRTAVSKRRRAG